MVDIQKGVEGLTIEGALTGFIILYAGLQFADPIFEIFQFITDIILYIVVSGITLFILFIAFNFAKTMAKETYVWIDYHYSEKEEYKRKFKKFIYSKRASPYYWE